MDTHIDFRVLPYAELMQLGQLAVEAMALSQEYDQERSRKYCELVAACNEEMLARRRTAARQCGRALT